MSYLHGVYGEIVAEANPQALEAATAMVIFGTAPVHFFGPDANGVYPNVSKPVVVNNMADARKLFGYSENWANYTLCEAFEHFFNRKAVGPLVVVNMLDPATHKSSTQTSVSKTPASGKITITGAEDIIWAGLEVWTTDDTPVKKTAGTDYNIAYDIDSKTITITSIDSGLGTNALTIKYNTIDVSKLTDSGFIGSTDGMGSNTGLYAVKDVYTSLGMIPSYLLAPGWSSHPDVHAAMITVSKKINSHWDAWVFADMPLVDSSNNQITLATAKTWKDANGYTHDNETVYFPMAQGANGKKYHLSTLAAANFLELLIDNDDLPYHTASNTACPIIQNLYLGESYTGRVYDDEIINEYLNKNGICSAAYVGGRWAIWGAHAASYDQSNKTYINVAETAMMMLFYISNNFQGRRPLDVDRPMTRNDVQTIVAEEQARLDALGGMGALTYGKVSMDAESDNLSDIMNGDFLFDFEVTTTPLAKSLKAKVIWVDNGFATYFGGEE